MPSDPKITIWTDEQVAALSEWQRTGRFHQFTCPGDYPECEKQRELSATRNGWVCACGKYRQDWAHDFMLGCHDEKQS